MSIPGVVPLFIDNVWKSLDGTASLRPFINEIDIDKPLTFSSVASRIYGDMSNATVTNRLLFQTSIANSYTALGLLPSGSHDTSVFTIFNNSSPSNSSIGSFSIDTDALSIQSGRIGSGYYLPIKVILGGLERVNISSSGFVGINESVPEAYLDIKGDIKLQNILLPTNTENKLYAMGNKLFWGNSLLSNLIEDEEASYSTTFSSNIIISLLDELSGDLINYIDEQNLVHKKYVDDKSTEILEDSINYTISTSGELVNYIDTEDNILRQYIDTLAIAVTGQGGGGSAYISGIVGEDVSRGQPVYQKESDGLWYLAQATSTQVSNLSIAVTSGTSGQTINFMRYGNLENLIGLPNSKELYLSQTIAGALTETVPTTGVIVYIGISRGTTNLDVAIGSVGFVPGSGGDTTGSGGPRWSYVLGGM